MANSPRKDSDGLEQRWAMILGKLAPYTAELSRQGVLARKRIGKCSYWVVRFQSMQDGRKV